MTFAIVWLVVFLLLMVGPLLQNLSAEDPDDVWPAGIVLVAALWPAVAVAAVVLWLVMHLSYIFVMIEDYLHRRRR